MAIRNPSPEELEQILNKNVEHVSINDTVKESNKNNDSVKNNDNQIIQNVPVGALKPKRSRFEPDPVKCHLISGPNYVSEGYIYVRRLNTEEESKLTQIKDAASLNSIINSIFQTAIKTNISINEMPLIDKMYVFIFILNISYVKEIKINDLISCEDCNDDYPYNVNFIDDLKINKLDKNVAPFKLSLVSFDQSYELCFNLPRIKNENSIYNKDVSEIISSITIYLRDEKGVDVPQEEWSEMLKWIDNEDKKKITEILTNVSSYGEKINLEINNCNNPSCRLKGKTQKIPIEELFTIMFNASNSKK
jgi:hypothetical protein